MKIKCMKINKKLKVLEIFSQMTKKNIFGSCQKNTQTVSTRGEQLRETPMTTVIKLPEEKRELIDTKDVTPTRQREGTKKSKHNDDMTTRNSQTTGRRQGSLHMRTKPIVSRNVTSKEVVKDSPSSETRLNK